MTEQLAIQGLDVLPSQGLSEHADTKSSVQVATTRASRGSVVGALPRDARTTTIRQNATRMAAAGRHRAAARAVELAEEIEAR